MADARGKLTLLQGNHDRSAQIPTIATGTAAEPVIWANRLGATVRVTEAGFTPRSALTGVDTNNLTLQVRNKGTDGTGTTGITTIKTYASGTDIAAHDTDVFTLSTTLTDRDVANGAVVALNKANNGSGLALPEGVAHILFQFN